MKQIDTFNRMVNGYAAQLFNELPAGLTLAQMEAFHELVASRLNYYRMHHTTGKRQGD